MFDWIKKTAARFFDWIDTFVQWLADVLDWAYQLLLDFLSALWDILTDFVCWIFEQILDICLMLIEQLDFSEIQQYTSAWGDLPSEIINVMGLCGVGDASIVILAAIVIRLILQLIPFVRLGS